MDAKILASLMVIGLVASAIGVGTYAYFSDTETSSGNTFTAGSLDLQVDIDGAWKNPWVGPFFDFTNVKPGDHGEKTISLHVDNDAWAWVKIYNLHNDDNGLTEPESEVDTTGGADQGELAQKLHFKIWADADCDNILDSGETILTEGSGITQCVVWPIDGGPETGIQPLTASHNYCIGVAWDIPNTVDNIIQSDSYTGDIAFYAVQAINNPSPTSPTC
jgi:predicted ribosomally synthesized peptide with SipW-like signal peptide